MEAFSQPFFSHAEPVLSVANVGETVKYWQEVLGFPNQWTWGDPPSYGGVSWHGAFIQFSLKSEASVAAQSQSIWIRVRHIEMLYQMHQEQNADIMVPLARQAYGFSEYVVKDNNGHFITFAAPASEQKDFSETLPENVKISLKKPTVEQYRKLFQAVGWKTSATDAMLEAQLNSLQAAITAEVSETGEVIGCALLIGDGFSFYYVKDVMVHPDWQKKHIGTAMMQELTQWLDTHAADKALVGLFTGEPLAPFYQQFQFNPAFGMIRIIDRHHQPMP
ncbi:GNAT family N-acetyltransferase [Dyadobacter sp. CY326]|uniref:GNAT family N-acetyltransferase n=1 Tax=Dyadobacter sp. CY326 TaxID=2907300 RepID=UPI001F1FB09A|nr:GNAT family N-acetyltransferase [Dyadobacter sp. CY326]MCE7066616.1 GNAT family N-acetyltransferase [Dyadobacter sp. CY326]